MYVCVNNLSHKFKENTRDGFCNDQSCYGIGYLINENLYRKSKINHSILNISMVFFLIVFAIYMTHRNTLPSWREAPGNKFAMIPAKWKCTNRVNIRSGESITSPGKGMLTPVRLTVSCRSAVFIRYDSWVNVIKNDENKNSRNKKWVYVFVYTEKKEKLTEGWVNKNLIGEFKK